MDCRIYQKGLRYIRCWVLGDWCWLVGVGCWMIPAIASAQNTGEQPPTSSTRNWSDSLRILNREIGRSAWSTDLHLRKAAVNLELQQWQYAIDEYGLILQHEAQNPAALFYRGYASMHLRHYDAARRDYEELLSIFPRHTECRLALAYVLQQTNHKTEALDQLNIVVEQSPDSVAGYAARAALEKDLKQYEAALYDWQQAVRRAPRNADYVASAVDILLLLNRRNEARRELDEAVSRGIPRGMLHQWYERCRKKR